ncbi:MAG: S41 family peptidase [Dehalococcoidales bacterium]|nr:S41 family peptidase [Dehalococcoidales bacterium]
MSKKRRTILITLLLVTGLVLSFGAGCVLGVTTSSADRLGLDVVTEAWDIIFNDYVDRDRLDASALSGAAIKGIIEEIDDPYSSYLNAETYQLSSSDLQGKFDGIGAHVGIRDGQLMIIAPIPGSPAASGGIKPGDIILEIDGSPASEMSLEEAVLHIRGPRGTSVSLLIQHQGDTSPEEITIVRAEIEITSVSFEMKGDIGYISINHFSRRTDEELSLALKSVSDEGATGLILDVRSNPGGLLEEVVDVASHFLKEGIVVYVVDNQGNRTSYSVKRANVTTELPVVVLTDNFSASGSEVLAGALQHYGRATIAGVTTYGKGSVNTLNRLKDGSALYITTARWLTPNERLIEGKGIAPDYKIDLEGDEAVQWAIDYLKGRRE